MGQVFSQGTGYIAEQAFKSGKDKPEHFNAENIERTVGELIGGLWAPGLFIPKRGPKPKVEPPKPELSPTKPLDTSKTGLLD